MFNFKTNFQFINYFKIFNILSILLILISIASIIFKGLNFGVDFKGGTLIELRVENNEVTISDVRNSFLKMNMGDVNVKKFGKESDYLIKFEKTSANNEDFIEVIKTDFKLQYSILCQC